MFEEDWIIRETFWLLDDASLLVEKHQNVSFADANFSLCEMDSAIQTVDFWISCS